MTAPAPIAQGFAATSAERLPLPARSTMTDAQRAAAEALEAGPRRAVIGPFIALMQSPKLLQRVADLGAALRFEGALPAALREFAIAVVARHTGNQFEWAIHAPAAVEHGIAPEAIEALRQGRRPAPLAPEAQVVSDVLAELLAHHGLADATYAAARDALGEAGVVELVTLAGYFSTVCWVMNVARTPAPSCTVGPLAAFPG